MMRVLRLMRRQAEEGGTSSAFMSCRSGESSLRVFCGAALFVPGLRGFCGFWPLGRGPETKTVRDPLH